MATPLQPTDRDFLVYESSRPGVAGMDPRYFKKLQRTLGKPKPAAKP